MMTEKITDFGPLQHLIGTWEGDKGMDVAPEKPATHGGTVPKEENPYSEIIVIEPFGDVTNAEEQTLLVLRYHQSVFRKWDNKHFHDEVGYWMWNPDNQTVMQSLQIPRAVGLLAGGKAREVDGSFIFEVSAGANNPDFGIVQSPFMQRKAKTIHFRHRVCITANTMQYSETTVLNIYGRTFEHTDTNILTRK